MREMGAVAGVFTVCLGSLEDEWPGMLTGWPPPACCINCLSREQAFPEPSTLGAHVCPLGRGPTAEASTLPRHARGLLSTPAPPGVSEPEGYASPPVRYDVIL